MLDAASRTGAVLDAQAGMSKPWLSARVQELIANRRATRNSAERARISKDIRKETRKGMRQYQTRVTEIVLQRFRGLDRIEHVRRQPVIRSSPMEFVKPERFADYFEDVYASSHEPLLVDRAALAEVPPFTAEEIKRAACHMSNAKCADEAGVVAEMVKHGSDLLHQRLADAYNRMLQEGTFEPDWHHTVLTMLPKSGDLTDPGNWRPIAVLRTLYKLLSRMLFHRLSPVLDAAQSFDQFGFRPGCSVDGAFTVLEEMMATTAEFRMPLWVASLDLKKAFDRLEFASLLQAVSEQGLPNKYTQLLAALYADQTAAVKGSRSFHIRRGVKQGDVISPILFNAGLELAFRRWKQRLGTEGWLLDDAGGRLTNTRFANDIMIYAKSLPELVRMLDSLTEELARVGLQLNAAKTKILTNDEARSHDDTPTFVDTAGGMLDLLPAAAVHRYLGRHICGQPRTRGDTELNHRIAQAWGKFHQHRDTMLNRNVSVAFVLSCSMLYGMAVLPLTARQLQRLDAVQRRMLRNIAGWVRIDDEPWEDTMRRMRGRVEAALRQHHVQSWSERVCRRRWEHAWHVARHPMSWPLRSTKWDPTACPDPAAHRIPCRGPGRPLTRWDDTLATYTARAFHEGSWQQAAATRTLASWRRSSDAYVQHCFTPSEA